MIESVLVRTSDHFGKQWVDASTFTVAVTLYYILSTTDRRNAASAIAGAQRRNSGWTGSDITDLEEHSRAQWATPPQEAGSDM